MARTLIVIAAFLTLSASAAFAVPPADKGKPEHPGNSAVAPGQSPDKNAAKACKAERGTTDASIAAFKAKYGPNPERGERLRQVRLHHGEEGRGRARGRGSEQAEENAAKKCKAERGTSDDRVATFKARYGPNAERGERFRQMRLDAREGTDVLLS